MTAKLLWISSKTQPPSSLKSEKAKIDRDYSHW